MRYIWLLGSRHWYFDKIFSRVQSIHFFPKNIFRGKCRMFHRLAFFSFFSFFIMTLVISQGVYDYCEKSVKNLNDGKCNTNQYHLPNKRYIFYDVNAPEGFNLRRDVYIRVATLVKKLSNEDTKYEWNLILPPWGHLHHWRSTDLGTQSQLPWRIFFDLESLSRYAPILEMYELVKEFESNNETIVIDQVYILENDEEMFATGHFKNKNSMIECRSDKFPYKKNNNGIYSGSFWDYRNITARKIHCLSFHGTVYDLTKNLQPHLYRTVMFDHMEIPLHHGYGTSDYWEARRSMRYNSKLYDIATEYRSQILNSNDVDEGIWQPEDWRLEVGKRTTTGGPYLAIHFRRQDFIIGHAASSPSVESAAFQIREVLRKLNLDTVFIATDTTENEYTDLKNNLNGFKVHRFIPTQLIKRQFKDGGVSIIDQIICSRARYFIGTHESTFSFRIQEDREILGFPAETTFNILCTERKPCFPINKWKIIWT